MSFLSSLFKFKKKSSNASNSDLGKRIELLDTFVHLQYMCAIIQLMEATTRDKVISFIFLDNAAFVIFRDLLSESQIQSLVMQRVFSSEGILSHLEVTMHEKQIAYGLLSNRDPQAFSICAKSDESLKLILGGNVEEGRISLSLLLSDPILLSQI